MSKILDLKAKRASIWDEAKKFLDDHSGNMTGDDLEKYENMETELDRLGREIGALERAEAFAAQMAAPTSTPVTNKPQGAPAVGDENKKAFFNYIRFGRVENASMTEGTGANGGYLAPTGFEKQIVQALADQNVFRSGVGATIIRTTSGSTKVPVVTNHGSAVWMTEGGSYTESNDTFSQTTLDAHKLGTMLKVSDELLQDSAFDIETYLANEFARRIGAKEEEGFIIGTGNGQPTGVFTANGASAGVTAASSSAITMDEVIDLFYSLKAPYRRNAVWLMNDSTVKAVRKLKDKNDQYLWQPSVAAGQPDTLLNRPVFTSSYVPTIAASAKVVAFGDFSFYWIADREGRTFRRLNERYADEGMVGFQTAERVDGKLLVTEAIKLLTMKA